MARFPSYFPSAHFEFDDPHFRRLHLERVRAHDPQLADTMERELESALGGEGTVVMVATEGERTFTFIAVPQATLDGEPGPRLLPSAEKNTVVVAVPIEVLGRKADDCLATVDPREAERKWGRLWDWYFERTLELLPREGPPSIPDVIDP